jgi:hypothetical protein
MKEYISPKALYNNNVPKGTLYVKPTVDSVYYIPKGNHINSLSHMMPAEIVEDWHATTGDDRIFLGDYLVKVEKRVIHIGNEIITKEELKTISNMFSDTITSVNFYGLYNFSLTEEWVNQILYIMDEMQ